MPPQEVLRNFYTAEIVVEKPLFLPRIARFSVRHPARFQPLPRFCEGNAS